tara:strand:+ start:29 stop:1105 length:1077 start_codon:yes stop_codon:yes gene_type:complete
MYYPNEKAIMQNALNTLSKISSAYEIIIPINGGSQADISSVQKLAADIDDRIRVENAEASTSKADNLNIALNMVSTPATLILDADHVLENADFELMHTFFTNRQKGVVCVQSSVLIRGNSTFEIVLSATSWYFFSILLPALECISGTAMFMGAMGMWDTEILRQYQFDKTILSEDDDLTMRCVEDGFSITSYPMAHATEMAPLDLRALFYQRLRWAIGYEQSLNRHIRKLCVARPRILFQRLYGWTCYVLVLCGVVQLVLTSVWIKSRTPSFQTLTFQLTFLLISFGTIAISVSHALARQQWRSWRSIVSIMPFVMFYAFFQTFVTLLARVRMLQPYDWNVTRRRTSVDLCQVQVSVA